MTKFFDNFRRLAGRKDFKNHQKVGREYLHIGKENKEFNIFPDIKDKLNIRSNTLVCDIGCGCSQPALDLIKFAKQYKNKLILIDSKEMLNILPNYKFMKKIPAEFPQCKNFIKKYQNSIDYIIIYSVIHYLLLEVSLFAFLDKAVSLLKNGGKMLIGDIPNITKKKRFLSSDYGKKFHQQWSGDKKIPKIFWTQLEEGVIDESIVFAILQRYRNMGCETYLLAQKDGLPFNKTREDILIVKNF